MAVTEKTPPDAAVGDTAPAVRVVAELAARSVERSSLVAGEGATVPGHLMLATSSGAPVQAAPTQLGRFVVLRTLGEGGMGVVYAAYDNELDRKVAIKLVRGALAGHATSRARIRREAQAMAKLSHPNVVQIYEVGEFRDQVFVAMEFVTGETLDTWAAAAREEPSRGWRAVLDVYVGAARGLAAAHVAGLIHRDFKPSSRGPPPEPTQPAERSLPHGFGRSGGGGSPEARPRRPE